MTKQITVLPDDLINKIAAGEVVENPASVVKELVENSIDAGATKITVELGGGGLHLIRVTDNGSGMDSRNAELALERHATSKLLTLDDLYSLATMGFRGEALPSIASVSEFQLFTCLKDKKEGTLISIKGGKEKTVLPVLCEEGTKIEVKKLFYNVPARKKFLKSPKQNAIEVKNLLIKLALSFPEKEFVYFQDQELIFSTKENSFLKRMEEVLGEEIASSFLSVEHEKHEISIFGYIGSSLIHRPNRLQQYLFVNKRSVVCPLISEAVRQGYGTSLPENRFPVFVLHFTFPKFSVDVNVHPQKKEIRLQYGSLVREMVIEAIQKTLHETFFFTPQNEEVAINYSPTSFRLSSSFIDIPDEKIPEEVKSWSFKTSFQVQEEKKEEFSLFFSPHLIGIFSSYFLFDVQSLSPFFQEETEGILFFDPARAKKRILFETYQKALLDKKREGSEALLFSFKIPLQKGEEEKILSLKSSLEYLGFSLNISSSFLSIEAIPMGFKEKQAENYIQELLHLEEEEIQNFEEKAKLCRLASFWALQHKTFSEKEALYLLKEILEKKYSHFCPDGKPIFGKITKDELENFLGKK